MVDFLEEVFKHTDWEQETPEMSRREFLKYGAFSLASLTGLGMTGALLNQDIRDHTTLNKFAIKQEGKNIYSKAKLMDILQKNKFWNLKEQNSENKQNIDEIWKQYKINFEKWNDFREKNKIKMKIVEHIPLAAGAVGEMNTLYPKMRKLQLSDAAIDELNDIIRNHESYTTHEKIKKFSEFIPYQITDEFSATPSQIEHTIQNSEKYLPVSKKHAGKELREESPKYIVFTSLKHDLDANMIAGLINHETFYMTSRWARNYNFGCINAKGGREDDFGMAKRQYGNKMRDLPSGMEMLVSYIKKNYADNGQDNIVKMSVDVDEKGNFLRDERGNLIRGKHIYCGSGWNAWIPSIGMKMYRTSKERREVNICSNN